MANTFRTMWLKKEDVQKAMDAFPEAPALYIGIEDDSINGQQILWVSNTQFGDKRQVVIVNKPLSEKEIK